MNVIGTRPTGWWRDRRGAMRRLVADLDRYARESGDHVTVVFDSAPFELEGERVEVAFASRSGRDAADDDIAALAGPGLTVVSSDSGLAERARAAGAQVLGAGAFRSRLES